MDFRARASRAGAERVSRSCLVLEPTGFCGRARALEATGFRARASCAGGDRFSDRASRAGADLVSRSRLALRNPADFDFAILCMRAAAESVLISALLRRPVLGSGCSHGEAARSSEGSGERAGAPLTCGRPPPACRQQRAPAHRVNSARPSSGVCFLRKTSFFFPERFSPRRAGRAPARDQTSCRHGFDLRPGPGRWFACTRRSTPPRARAEAALAQHRRDPCPEHSLELFSNGEGEQCGNQVSDPHARV